MANYHLVGFKLNIWNDTLSSDETLIYKFDIMDKHSQFKSSL